MAFMQDLNEELWKLGVYAKTEHNEVAPAQHEIAPVFSTTNIATDHNQLTMEMMKKVAERHGLACLLHEKPFAGVNGNGKHNNWSLSTNLGENLLNPGKVPQDNKQFLLFVCAVLCAVDKYQGLLRVSVANAGNDHRLGANEAPPAIVSVFLGDELTAIMEAIERGERFAGADAASMKTGVHVIPEFMKDTTDRNRTSPFAFTGNKFEFRMVGSTFSISGPNIVLNTIVADVLADFAEQLEGATDFDAALKKLMQDTVRKHKRIIFNGNNYAPEWVEEAERRGLLNLKSTVEALPYFVSDTSINLFTKHNVFSETEIRSRYEILVETYSKTINIEALTTLDMAKRDIIPAVLAYGRELAEGVAARRAVGIDLPNDAGAILAEKVTGLTNSLLQRTEELDDIMLHMHDMESSLDEATYMRDKVIPAMQELRAVADQLEMVTAADYWPYPTYGDMLYYV
jgi:glutamine synthetase